MKIIVIYWNNFLFLTYSSSLCNIKYITTRLKSLFITRYIICFLLRNIYECIWTNAFLEFFHSQGRHLSELVRIASHFCQRGSFYFGIKSGRLCMLVDIYIAVNWRNKYARRDWCASSDAARQAARDGEQSRFLSVYRSGRNSSWSRLSVRTRTISVLQSTYITTAVL